MTASKGYGKTESDTCVAIMATLAMYPEDIAEKMLGTIVTAYFLTTSEDRSLAAGRLQHFITKCDRVLLDKVSIPEDQLTDARKTIADAKAGKL